MSVAVIQKERRSLQTAPLFVVDEVVVRLSELLGRGETRATQRLTADNAEPAFQVI
jgi:hypothetical protein